MPSSSKESSRSKMTYHGCYPFLPQRRPVADPGEPDEELDEELRRRKRFLSRRISFRRTRRSAEESPDLTRLFSFARNRAIESLALAKTTSEINTATSRDLISSLDGQRDKKEKEKRGKKKRREKKRKEEKQTRKREKDEPYMINMMLTNLNFVNNQNVKNERTKKGSWTWVSNS